MPAHLDAHNTVNMKCLSLGSRTCPVCNFKVTCCCGLRQDSSAVRPLSSLSSFLSQHLQTTQPTLKACMNSTGPPTISNRAVNPGHFVTVWHLSVDWLTFLNALWIHVFVLWVSVALSLHTHRHTILSTVVSSQVLLLCFALLFILTPRLASLCRACFP